MAADRDDQDFVVSYRFLVRDSYGLALKEQVTFTPLLLVGDFSREMTGWKVVSVEIPLYVLPGLPVHLQKHTDLFQQLLRVPFSSGTAAGRKLNLGIPA